MCWLTILEKICGTLVYHSSVISSSKMFCWFYTNFHPYKQITWISCTTVHRSAGLSSITLVPEAESSNHQAPRLYYSTVMGRGGSTFTALCQTFVNWYILSVSGEQCSFWDNYNYVSDFHKPLRWGFEYAVLQIETLDLTHPEKTGVLVITLNGIWYWSPYLRRYGKSCVLFHCHYFQVHSVVSWS